MNTNTHSVAAPVYDEDGDKNKKKQSIWPHIDYIMDANKIAEIVEEHLKDKPETYGSRKSLPAAVYALGGKSVGLSQSGRTSRPRPRHHTSCRMYRVADSRSRRCFVMQGHRRQSFGPLFGPSGAARAAS